jgi:predicted ATPase
MAPSLPPLIGRSAEREAIATAFEGLGGRQGGMVAIEGEPGIGKSRLLAHLEAGAAADGSTVLAGRASEFEVDLPYALWTEALDRHLADAGERRLARLGLADPSALGMALPSLSELGSEPAQGDRHRTHRALRDLLECLAATRPLLLCLDDVHWADSASVEALAALIRRPPSGRVLLAVAAREGRLPAALAAALAAALREGRLTRLVLAPLSEPEAVEMVGEAAAAIYQQSGGTRSTSSSSRARSAAPPRKPALPCGR